MTPPPPLPLAEAQARLLAHVEPLAAETLPAEQAVGRYLAEPLAARRRQPAADLSAMDGYAMRAGDLAGPWRVVGESAAGHPFPGELAHGEAIRISTGAMMPAGEAVVLLQENAARDGERLALNGEGEPSARHVRRAGFDFRTGDEVFASGTRIGPAQLALALAAGHGDLPVHRLPSLAVLDSGDELAADPTACAPHQVPASNGAMLAAMAAPHAAAIARLGPVPDRLEAMLAALAKASAADVVVTSGGASVGDHDLVRPALERWGATIDFWRVAVLLRTNLAALRGQLVNALAIVGIGDAQVLSSLPQDIGQEQQRLALLTQPLYVVVLQVLGLALLFVGAMAGLLIEGRAGAIATLKSRGAGRFQMLASYALLGLLLGGIAALAGPWLASRLSVALIQWLVPATTLAAAHVTGDFLAGLASPRTAVPPAIGGALLGAGAVVVAAARAAQLDVLAFRREQGRSGRSFWRRYFVDLQLAAVCVLAFVELSQFGGLGTRETLGSAANSPLLLLAPGLLLLAGTLVLLRIFPYAVGAGLRLAARTRGAAGMLAFAQVGRSPSAPTRLTLLLALAVGLGLFAIAFDTSLARNAADRAAYQAGADLRLVQQSAEPDIVDGRIQAQLRALPGVAGISAVERDRAYTTDEQGNFSINVLAVDPATWQQVAGATSWRADYGSMSSASLMAGLRAHQWGASAADRAGQTNAGDAEHPVWAIVSQTYASVHHLRVGDRFAMVIGGSNNAPATFQVGAIVSYFPTLYPSQAAQGFVVVGVNDYFGAVTLANGVNSANSVVIGPNEYWLALTGGQSTHDKLLATLTARATQLDINRLADRQALQLAIVANPIQSGVRGLLLVGAFIAAGLAVLGSIIQSAITARARNVQFAVLRTLGLTNGNLTRVLLGEQLVVYVFGLLGGTLLGALLATATLPFLQFGDTTVDVTQVGVPPVLLAASPLGVLVFYAALVVAFVAALVIAGIYAARTGLGQALRIGED